MKIQIIVIRKGGREEIPTELFYYCYLLSHTGRVQQLNLSLATETSYNFKPVVFTLFRTSCVSETIYLWRNAISSVHVSVHGPVHGPESMLLQ